MFAYNPFKLDLLHRLPADAAITAYRCGPFIDLCRGPHIARVGVGAAANLAFDCVKVSGSHWDGMAGAGGTLLQVGGRALHEQARKNIGAQVLCFVGGIWG